MMKFLKEIWAVLTVDCYQVLRDIEEARNSEDPERRKLGEHCMKCLQIFMSGKPPKD